MKIKQIGNVIGIIAILILVSSFFFAFYGSPWGKIIAKKEISQYLRDKYPKDTKVGKVYYEFIGGRYCVNVYSVQDNIQFTVKRLSGHKYWDSYSSSIWQKEIADDIKRNVNITDNTEIDVLMLEYFTEHEKQPQIPHYADALEKIINLKVLVINDVDAKINYSQLMQIISVLENIKVNYSSIYVNYSNAKEQKIIITQKDAENINSVDEMQRFINMYRSQ